MFGDPGICLDQGIRHFVNHLTSTCGWIYNPMAALAKTIVNVMGEVPKNVQAIGSKVVPSKAFFMQRRARRIVSLENGCRGSCHAMGHPHAHRAGTAGTVAVVLGKRGGD